MLNLKKMLTKISDKFKTQKITPTTTYIGACSFTRFGDVVQLNITNIKNIPTGSTTLLTIPSGYRPNSDTSFDLIQPRGYDTTITVFLRVTVKVTGELNVYNYSNRALADTNCSGTLTYIALSVGTA